MDRESLRNVQQPLKDRYRSEPDTALVTLHAEGALGEGVTCSVQTGRALVETVDVTLSAATERGN